MPNKLQQEDSTASQLSLPLLPKGVNLVKKTYIKESAPPITLHSILTKQYSFLTHHSSNTDDCYITFDDLCIFNFKSEKRTMDNGHHIDQDENNDDDSKYKSKNLKAERRRRKKLSDRQLELRALVPIITNMNKATIITDAITYIEELKTCVEELSNQLLQMEATSFGEEKIKTKESDVEQEMKKLGIRPAEAEAEVEVNHFSGTKLWIKMVFEKKRGGLTKLMEAISMLGIDLNDTSITTSRGAVLFTTFGEGTRGGLLEAEQMKKYLLEIIRST